MKLYIMRHGEAAASGRDLEPTLTNAGRQAIEQLAARLGRQGLHVNQVLHSEKARARQTAEIMAQHLAPSCLLQIHPQIKPNDDPHSVLGDIAGWQDDTLLVSHLPFIPDLIALLTGKQQSAQTLGYVPGTVVCLRQDGDDWVIEAVETP